MTSRRRTEDFREAILRQLGNNVIIKVSDVSGVEETFGLVCGWAIVCKILNPETGVWEDYYDLNVDQEGVHKGQRIPENITEPAVICGLIEIAKNGTVLPGNEEHQGPDTGRYAGMFFMNEEIAKRMGMTTTKSGLMVQYHASPEVLQKFKDGKYTGFSIEGARVEFEEVEEFKEAA